MALEGCLFSFMQFLFAPDVPLTTLCDWLDISHWETVCHSLFMLCYPLLSPQLKVLGACVKTLLSSSWQGNHEWAVPLLPFAALLHELTRQ